MKAAAPIVGGGGGGRDTMAQAGGKRSGEAARGAGDRAGRDREGARADARPRARPRRRPLRLRPSRIPPARSRRRSRWWSGRTPRGGSRRSRGWSQEKGAERVVVGLPLTLRGDEGEQAERARDVCRAAGAESLGTGGASRRAPHDATRGAHRGRGRCRLPRRRAPARELPGSHRGGRPRVSAGPPPVPGGRTPEEREAARREREARRAGQRRLRQRSGRAGRSAGRACPRTGTRDWLGRGAATADRRAPPASRGRRRARRAGPGARPVALVALARAPRDRARHRLVRQLALPAVQGRRRGQRPGHDPAGLQPRRRSPTCSSRPAWSSAGFFQLRARLAGHSGDLKPGSYELRKDMSFTRRARRARSRAAAERRAGPDPRGPLAQRDQAAHEGAPRQLPAASRRSPKLDPATYKAPRGAEPRGLPVPGHLRAEAGTAGQASS